MWVKGASTYLGRKTFIWTQGLTSWDLSTSDGESKLELDRGCIPEAFGERQKERETERQTETAVQSLYLKKIVPLEHSKVFFFKENSKEIILDILCFCFSRFWLRLKTNGVVDQIAWLSCSSVDWATFFAHVFSEVICISSIRVKANKKNISFWDSQTLISPFWA